jgi:uncharacterized protein YggE
MRRQSALAALALSVMLVTAGCASVLGTGESPQSNPAPQSNANENVQAATNAPGDPGRTIAVAASGQVQTQPNQAILRVAVEATGESASTVRQRLAENVSQMRAALAEMGIEGDQISTADYDIRNQQRFGGREDAERPPFRGRHAFTITLTDLNRTGRVIVTAVENGATSVDDVRFTLSEETRRELRKEALADAMSSAREQASVIADQSDLSIAGVGSVQTADVGFRPVRFEGSALAGGDGGGGGTSIEGGAVTVTAQVQVTYNATATE